MFQFEPIGDEFAEATRASMNIEVAVAGFAVEVMMVLRCGRCQFVSIAAAGDRDDDDFLGLLKFANDSIDRSKAQ